jgi:cell division protein ZapA
MSQITVRINGRPYPVTCDNGKEERVLKLAEYLDTRVQQMAQQVGQVGDARLLVLASLLLADELADVYDELARLRPADAQSAKTLAAPAAPRAAAAAGSQLALELDRLAQRVERIADTLAAR